MRLDKSWTLIVVAVAMLAYSSDGLAQRGGDRRGGDRRDGDRRDGDRRDGDRRDGDRGRGGPPSRGGPPGRGGPGGGFDPSGFITRMDSNGNGQLDPSEMEGRAKYMIQRMMPKADLSKPIPLRDVSKAFEEARRRWSGGGDRNSDRDRDKESSSSTPEPEPLVPGFGVEVNTETVPGFGDAGDLYGSISAEDRERAQGTLARYDQNKDGLLDREEVRRGRWRDDPYQYDFNGDRRLTLLELSARYTKRRIDEEAHSDSSSSERGDDDRKKKSDWRSSDKEKSKKSSSSNTEKSTQKSYRTATAHELLPEDIPDWFRDKDKDRDGQLLMAEYASRWEEATVARFAKLDQNGDGVLTPQEYLAVENNASEDPERNSVAATPTESSSDESSSNEIASAESTSTKSTSSTKSDSGSAKATPAYMTYAAGLIKKYDKNSDGKLNKHEWGQMSRDPSAADRDKNGQITTTEYAIWLNGKWN